MRRISESLVDIEDCVGITSTPPINNHVLPKVENNVDDTNI